MFFRILALFMTATPVAATATECGNWHIVKRGESLSLVAGQAYDNVHAYERIWQANLDTIGGNPARVEAGAEIYIPCPDPEALRIEGWNVLPAPADLANLLKIRDIQIIDIRPADKTGGVFIPDAINIPFSAWRGPADNPGQPPDAAALSALFSTNGLRIEQPTVIVHTRDDPMDMGRAAYVYWLLKTAGLQQIGILDGGMKAWTDANLRTEDAPRRRPAQTLRVNLDATWWASTDEVEAIAEGRIAGALIDTRPEGMFAKSNGDGQPLATTLPGAVSFSVPKTFSVYKSATDHRISVLDRLKGASVNWENTPVVNFCNTGELGALSWFYASELSGIENVKLYPESSHGWTFTGHDLAPGVVEDSFDDL